MNSVVHCQLWMGSLEPYMTENFIMAAFQKMGEDPQTVKLMRNKYTGEPAGYCFVNFLNDEQAVDAMHKLNGKPIPGTNPVVRFRLNSASNQSKALPGADREFSVWVGDLSSDVDDYNLYRAFSSKYTSIKTAKVILDSSGFSKGYGFVRFGLEEEQKNALYEMNGFIGLGSRPLKICMPCQSQRAPAAPHPQLRQLHQPQVSSRVPTVGQQTTRSTTIHRFSKGYGFVRFGLEEEQKNALYEMNGYIGLGSRPLKICNAVPKPKGASSSTSSTPATPSATSILQSAYSGAADYTQYYDPSYWQGYAWQGYYDQQQGADATAYYHQAMSHHAGSGHTTSTQSDWSSHHHAYEAPHEDEDMSLVEHKFTLDADKLNRETVERDRNLWDALESSKWLPIEQLEVF
uniref:tRNA selenocysteine-associated protein 1 n=1 Tax=Lutzomyia longipalpis TaxID=7200 RepID=A0A1B0CKS9_LUTLO